MDNVPTMTTTDGTISPKKKKDSKSKSNKSPEEKPKAKRAKSPGVLSDHKPRSRTKSLDVDDLGAPSSTHFLDASLDGARDTSRRSNLKHSLSELGGNSKPRSMIIERDGHSTMASSEEEPSRVKKTKSKEKSSKKKVASSKSKLSDT
jgi:hypothetical protein